MKSTMQDTPLSIGQLVRFGTSIHPAAEVTTWSEHGPSTVTFEHLGKRAAQLAHGLRSIGIDDDQRVATFMWNNAPHMEAYMAVPAMGAVLHTLNIRLFPEQLTYIVNHAEDQVIIADASLLPLLTPLLPTMPTVRHLVVVDVDPADVDAPDGIEVLAYEALLEGRPEEFDWPELDERSAAAMCYTSGTTGDPKGVVYSHRSIWLHSMQACMSDAMGLAQSDKVLAIVPMFHAMSWGLPYAALMVGTSLIMPDRFLQPAPLAEMMSTLRPTAAAAVPTIWQALLVHLDEHPADLSSLRDVLVGGSACPPSLMRAFHEKYGIHITQAWGMTETSPVGTSGRPDVGLSAEEEFDLRCTQGRFIAAVRARLVDDSGKELPWDGKQVGELEVRGPWITGSYYRNDAHDKFDDGWLRTGDVGTISPGGYLTLTDRSKDIIKSGGEWISSVELENHVMEHPAVREAAVIGVPDQKWDERPLVAVVVRDGEKVAAEELRSFLDGRVAHWQLPERWTFIDEVPKTSVGKYDKKRLRSSHADGALNVIELG
ncbi:long-chain fatty acid--CoA ligase [Rhodococcus sp. 06-156-3C]|uniref:long-chain fatty acid--CoA ligase n=1 Tax=Nocardiaceae TaxID=85025 RepID=UPI000522EA03|nr:MULTISPECIES: long-chain fatty acid--CoA ligase [Rhodococcus]OZD11001.1 long-chain fatty acid--CoA ligase [Rhodococcus sp. 06-156-4C]OZD14415.1 long-chain fatty acid--CoA ligase [Rhodococcus sp. 06-156-4a]OZD24749.1 long-chain fatty acid--CoA ligase [Rhodococcus sp. 06-156-3C]OZD27723.1 long-chain fatty acid--CoA ligase [Rhodococcus sp. 06-156-3b]OZD39704.1 long-chain fatty acid--CoA ligase [Rhodococcus sp. 06-156-3]